MDVTLLFGLCRDTMDQNFRKRLQKTLYSGELEPEHNPLALTGQFSRLYKLCNNCSIMYVTVVIAHFWQSDRIDSWFLEKSAFITYVTVVSMLIVIRYRPHVLVEVIMSSRARTSCRSSWVSSVSSKASALSRWKICSAGPAIPPF